MMTRSPNFLDASGADDCASRSARVPAEKYNLAEYSKHMTHEEYFMQELSENAAIRIINNY